MSRVVYANTVSTADQEALRVAHQVRPVADTEEGTGVNALPGGVYGYTYAPGLLQRAALRGAPVSQLRDTQAAERPGVRDRVRDRRHRPRAVDRHREN
jgi:hypothetical protein